MWSLRGSSNHFRANRAIFGMVTNEWTTNRLILEQACSWPVWEGSLLQKLLRSWQDTFKREAPLCTATFCSDREGCEDSWWVHFSYIYSENRKINKIFWGNLCVTKISQQFLHQHLQWVDGFGKEKYLDQSEASSHFFKPSRIWSTRLLIVPSNLAWFLFFTG